MASVWYWRISLQVGCFDTLRFTKIQVPFLRLWWYRLILQLFFKFFCVFYRLLIFFRSKDDFCYLELILMCFAIGGGPERFFRTRYHILPWVTIHLTTHVIILLWEFCTVSNAQLLYVHHYINCCMPYYTFSVK